MELRLNEHDKSDRLFHRRLVPTLLSEYEYDFFELLEAIQLTGEAINKKADVRSAFDILKSSRRGVTAYARNMKISRNVIEAVNRWRKEVMSGGVSLRLVLIDVYTSLEALAPTILEFSRGL